MDDVAMNGWIGHSEWHWRRVVVATGALVAFVVGCLIGRWLR